MNRDDHYTRLLLEPIYICAQYKPRMGQGRGSGYDLNAYQELYQADPLYSWLGLDNPLMYAAHKAAGGMTSIYRQIGIGCERLFRQILMDELELTPDEANWSYQSTMSSGKIKRFHLDCRIPLDAINDPERKSILTDWMIRAAEDLGVAKSVRNTLTGVVFEVRQGYKSKDSKRQNADIANAASAYVNTYLPCIAVLSNQIDGDVHSRYRLEKWAVLTGASDLDNDLHSVYSFSRNIIGYDMAGFFERNADTFRREVANILRSLLEVDKS